MLKLPNFLFCVRTISPTKTIIDTGAVVYANSLVGACTGCEGRERKEGGFQPPQEYNNTKHD